MQVHGKRKYDSQGHKNTCKFILATSCLQKRLDDRCINEIPGTVKRLEDRCITIRAKLCGYMELHNHADYIFFVSLINASPK